MRDYLDNRPIKLTGSTPRRSFATALILCLLSIVLIVGDVQGILRPVRGVLAQAVNPAAQQLTALRDNVVGFWAGVPNVSELRTENEDLQRQVSQLQEDLIEFEQLKVENDQLRQQLEMEQDHPWHLHGSEVIVRSPDAGRRVVTIASGSNQGVEPGMAVVGRTDDGPTALVGIIEETTARTSSVLLITDFSSHISARMLHDEDTALGIAHGQWQRGSRLRLERIEREIELNVGDTVISAGLTSELGLPLALAAVPAGIPIGTVEALSMEGHTQTAELRPYVDPDQVRYVWVILSHEE